MSINENRNGNMNNSKIFLPQPKRFLNQEEFSDYLELTRKIANFDKESKKWYLNEYKVKTLTPERIREIADRLKEYIGDEIYDILSGYLKDDNENVKAEIKGNYLIVYDDINKYRSLLTYKVKSFDYKSGQYVENEILLGWQKPGYFLTLRGLFWKIRTISNISLKPFANLQFYNIQLKNFELRDYQLESVKAWLNDANITGNAVIKAPTGSGKSIIAILSTLEILKNKPNAKVIYAVNSTTLLRQFQNFAKKEDLDFILISGEINELEKGQKSNLIALSLAYYYSQKKRNQNSKLKELVNDADLIVIDEAHHTPANMVKSLLLDAPNSIRIGLTATPIREDNREMEIMGFLGRITYSISYDELVKNGYLAPIEYIQFTPKIPPKLAKKIQKLEKYKEDLNFAQYYSMLLKLFEKSPLTNLQIIRKIKELGQYPALVIVRRISIAKHMAELMQKEGIKADYVTSKTKLEERIEKIENLKNGKLQVLIATSLADEGLDIPMLRLIVLMTQGKSRIKLIQRIGRVMRVYKGKQQGYVLDISYNHDLFIRQAQKRIRFIEKEYEGIVKIIS